MKCVPWFMLNTCSSTSSVLLGNNISGIELVRRGLSGQSLKVISTSGSSKTTMFPDMWRYKQLCPIIQSNHSSYYAFFAMMDWTLKKYKPEETFPLLSGFCQERYHGIKKINCDSNLPKKQRHMKTCLWSWHNAFL